MLYFAASRGVVDRRLAAVDEDLAAVALVGAREHLHQRRLAGAVVAEHADHLAGVEVDRDVVDGLDAAEGDFACRASRRAGSGTVDLVAIISLPSACGR
jgi:hypothetical protein